jgi:hypothetical protein
LGFFYYFVSYFLQKGLPFKLKTILPFSVDPLVSPPVNLPELNPEQSRKRSKSIFDIFFTVVVVVTTGLVDADEGVVVVTTGAAGVGGVTGFAVTCSLRYRFSNIRLASRICFVFLLIML